MMNQYAFFYLYPNGAKLFIANHSIDEAGSETIRRYYQERQFVAGVKVLKKPLVVNGVSVEEARI